MIDRRRVMRRGWRIALAAGWAFAALSVIGYDPGDWPSAAASPANQPAANPCGAIGAAAAFALMEWIGWATLVLLWAWGVWLWSLHRRKAFAEPKLTAIGLAIAVAAASALIEQTLSSHPGLVKPETGAGGLAGAVLATAAVRLFGGLGSFLIFAGSALAGVSLAREALALYPFREARAAAGGMIQRIRSWPIWGKRRTRLAFVGIPAAPADSDSDSAVGMAVPSAGSEGAAQPDGAAPAVASRAIVRPATTPSSARPAANGPAPPPQAPPTEASGSVANVPALRVAAKRPEAPSARTLDEFETPSLSLLDPPSPYHVQEQEAKLHERAMILEQTLLDFGHNVRVVQIDTGPVITLFEIELEAGLRVSRISSLADDLARALAVPSVRIVAPIPGKTNVGIEVPNDRRTFVKLGEVIESIQDRIDRKKIPLFLGKDIKGNPLIYDLADMPHLLIAGRTGTGKSVCLNAIILSILMTKRPDQVKMVLIDPKMVELSQFKRIPHLMHPVVTDMKKAEAILSCLCDMMDERYSYLARAGVRNVQSYNALGADEIYERLRPEDETETARIPTHMPYIVVVADEMADMIMTSPKEVEAHIVRLAQKARAVGIHLIVATQRPTVDVVTGLIKGNLPARIAFQVASRNDSRVILDEMGADRLLGNGDMLFLIPGTSHTVRAQGAYVSDAEVNRVCEYLQAFPPEYSKELMQMQVSGSPGGKDRSSALKERDALYESAIEIVIREGRGSCSLLQRALGIGYGRASRLIDFMAEDGIVGEYKAGGPREVLVSLEEWEAMKSGGSSAEMD